MSRVGNGNYFQSVIGSNLFCNIDVRFLQEASPLMNPYVLGDYQTEPHDKNLFDKYLYKLSCGDTMHIDRGQLVSYCSEDKWPLLGMHGHMMDTWYNECIRPTANVWYA